MEKLLKGIKNKWVNALLSGKYIQATGKLCKGVNYEGQYEMCCLGVLEHILGTDHQKMINNYASFPDDLDKPKSPKLILERSDSTTTDRTICEKLAYMNDGIEGIKKKSFKYIASYINRYL